MRKPWYYYTVESLSTEILARSRLGLKSRDCLRLILKAVKDRDIEIAQLKADMAIIHKLTK